jgi:hypothetical protein
MWFVSQRRWRHETLSLKIKRFYWAVNRKFTNILSITYKISKIYNARSDWSRVYIRRQSFPERACTCYRFKIFYSKSNIKRLLVSIYCDINTTTTVRLPSCLYHSIQTRAAVLYCLTISYRAVKLWRISGSKRTKTSLKYSNVTIRYMNR